MVGVDTSNDQVIGVGVTTHQETPGLGSRAKTDPKLAAQFNGLPITETFKVSLAKEVASSTRLRHSEDLEAYQLYLRGRFFQARRLEGLAEAVGFFEGAVVRDPEYALAHAGLAEPFGVYDYGYNTPSGALVNVWWYVNEAHDRFYALGFDEAAGNFQQDNFGQGGTGGDPVRVVFLPNGQRNLSMNVSGGVAQR